MLKILSGLCAAIQKESKSVQTGSVYDVFVALHLIVLEHNLPSPITPTQATTHTYLKATLTVIS